LSDFAEDLGILSFGKKKQKKKKKNRSSLPNLSGSKGLGIKMFAKPIRPNACFEIGGL